MAIIIVGVISAIIFLSWKIYEYQYFKSKRFLEIKESISEYVNDCNELNEYIECLKETKDLISSVDYGESNYFERSVYNYKRPEFKNISYEPFVHNCSRTVFNNARKQPFKYICKYFLIKEDDDSLQRFEKMLNNFEAVENGKKSLKKQKEKIYKRIENEIPFLIKNISGPKLFFRLGFEYIDFSNNYFPKFVFSYVSSGGYSSMRHETVMNIENLNRFVNYLAEKVKFRKSMEGQRALMTSQLRKQIIERDDYTCQICNNSTRNEPNLLLEVDHIIPISKGGITSFENLQTLCWKCNRTKGNKII